MNTPILKLIDALRAHGIEPKRSGSGWSCRCPSHDDRTPSLSIAEGENGRALVRCHADHGCTAESITAALGLSLADLMPPDPARAPTPHKGTTPRPSDSQRPTFASADEALQSLDRTLGARSGVWPYHDRAGEPCGIVARWETPNGKTYRPLSREASGGWRIGAMPTPRPLYRLPDLLACAPGARVFLCEGERATDAARSLGFIATTSAGGAKAAGASDWSALKGLNVVILPDADGPGERYAEEVARLAHAAGAKSVRIVRLPGLPAGEGGDVADYIDARDSMESETIAAQIESLALHAPEETFPAPIESERARNEWVPVPITELGPTTPPDWIWPGYIARGHITLLTGLWKAGKSTLIGHLIHDLQAGGGLVPAPVNGKTLIVTEEGSSLWMRRRDDLNLGASVHLLVRPFKSRSSPAEWSALIDTLAARVGSDHYSTVIFDTLASCWPVVEENDAANVMAAITPLHALTEAGAAVLLIHHPRKGDAAEGQASRGSGALPGAVDTILEFRRYSPEDHHDRRRVLRAYSRWEETPPESVLELRDDGYFIVGDKAEVRQSDRLNILTGLIPSGGDGLTVEELLAAWPTEPKPGERTLRLDLKNGADAHRWQQLGSGRKNEPFRYRRTG